MKKMFKYIVVLCFLVLLIACEKQAEEPEILLFEAIPSTVAVGKEVKFRYQVKAEYVTIWTGNQKTSQINREYNGFLEQISNPPMDAEKSVNRFYNKGIALEVTDTTYVYTLYKNPGTYTVVLIATNSGKLGEELKRKQASLQLEVIEATQ